MPTYAYDRWNLDLIYRTVPTGMTAMEHVHRMNVMPSGAVTIGTPFPDIAFVQRGGGTVPGDEFADEYGDLIEPFFPNATTIARWELWKIPAGVSVRTLYSQLEIGHVGSGALPSTPAWQSTFTFRTLGGKWGKAQFMEPLYTDNGTYVAPYPVAAAVAYAAYVIAANTVFMGEDNEYFWANLHWSNGQNEKLWRKRYRSA